MTFIPRSGRREDEQERLARLISQAITAALAELPDGKVIVVPKIDINVGVAGQDAKVIFGGSDKSEGEARAKLERDRAFWGRPT